MKLFRWPRRNRPPAAYLRAMQRELGPLIWPDDHTHEIDPWRMTPAGIQAAAPVRDCPACIRLYTHRDGCECGHCDAPWRAE